MKAILAALALFTAVQAAACAQTALPQWPLALTAAPAKDGAKLAVTSPAFVNGGAIPQANTQYGENKFPGLAWSGAPAGTKSFAILMQDTDPPAPYAAVITIVHWIEFNIPASIKTLAPNDGAAASGAVFGANMTGKAAPYAGPRPPAGGPVHHYHFQIFALDERLPLTDGAKLDEFIAAMKGHVLASGEVVGTYQGPAKAP